MNIFQILGIPFLAVLCFLSYWFLFILFGYFIPFPEDISNKPQLFVALILPSFIATIGVVSMFSYALAKTYQDKAQYVAFVLAIPVLIVSSPTLLSLQSPFSDSIIGFFENFTFLTLLLIGTAKAQYRINKQSDHHASKLNSNTLAYPKQFSNQHTKLFLNQ